MEDTVVIESPRGANVPALVVEPADGAARATVILAHGIFTEKDERGRFRRQSAMLSSLGFRSLRFDFRGHGDHEIPPERITLGGMLEDFSNVVKHTSSHYGDGPLVLVASSFGASIALLHMISRRSSGFDRIVLLNPVIDYWATFIEPQGIELKEIFGDQQWDELSRTGYMTPLPGFRFSEEFILEMKVMKPYLAFDFLRTPTRVIHGNADTSVRYEITMAYALRSPSVDLQIVDGANHAFAEPKEEQESFRLIAEWLQKV